MKMISIIVYYHANAKSMPLVWGKTNTEEYYGSTKVILCLGRRGQMGSSSGSTLTAISFAAEGISSASDKSIRYGDSPVQGINSTASIAMSKYIKVAKLALITPMLSMVMY